MFIPMWASQQLLAISNINLTGGHLYFHKQHIHLPFGTIDRLVSPFTSASAFLLSHRILLCARVVALSEKASTIQYGYRKWGTHARVFSQILAHGNSKNEIRQWNRRRRTEERREYGKKYRSGHEK